MAVHISPQAHHMPVGPDAAYDAATAGAECLDDYYPAYSHMSFLERQEGARGRPLAWRSGLPLSATAGGMMGLPVKNMYTGDIQAIYQPCSMDDIRWEMQDFLKSMVWANHDMLRTRPSQLEGPQQRAVYVKDDDEAAGGGGFGGFSSSGSSNMSARPRRRMPAWLRPTGGEHLHIHPDGSSHMILSLADATTAVDCGWAEAHAIDSRSAHNGAMLPLGYVSVHAPRDMLELAEWKKLVLASVRFCTYSWVGAEIRRPEHL